MNPDVESEYVILGEEYDIISTEMKNPLKYSINDSSFCKMNDDCGMYDSNLRTIQLSPQKSSHKNTKKKKIIEISLPATQNKKIIKVPTKSSHPERKNPIIPLDNEDATYLSVPIQNLSEKYYNVIKLKNQKIKSGNKFYINVPEEWIYYEGNPAFINNDLLSIFS